MAVRYICSFVADVGGDNLMLLCRSTKYDVYTYLAVREDGEYACKPTYLV